MNDEDSDIKTSLPGSEKAVNDDDDAMALVREAHTQKMNGNIQKAKSLGSQIVSTFSYSGAGTAPDDVLAIIDECSLEPDDKLFEQIKILTVFTAEYCIDHYLPSKTLSTVALSRAYDVLQENYPEFYIRLADSMSFSFYYLSAGSGGDVTYRIGYDFAMLCGHKNDKKYADLGTALIKHYTEIFRRAIDSFVFV